MARSSLRLTLALSALTAGLGLAAPPSPSPGPTPTPDLQPSYFADLFARNPNQRWPDAKAEILVYLGPEKNPKRTDAQTAKLVLEAARSWSAATPDGPKFRRVSSPDIADVRIGFARQVLGDAGLGESQVTFEVAGDDPGVGDGTLTGATVTLRAGLSDALLKGTATHELGHVLGLVGRTAALPSHSPLKTDLMGAYVRARSQLTQRDFNTMAQLYRLPRPGQRGLNRKRFTIRTRMTKTGCAVRPASKK